MKTRLCKGKAWGETVRGKEDGMDYLIKCIDYKLEFDGMIINDLDKTRAVACWYGTSAYVHINPGKAKVVSGKWIDESYRYHDCKPGDIKECTCGPKYGGESLENCVFQYIP